MTSETYALGLKVRREMLGDEFVDNALNSADDLTRPWQDMLVECCFGKVWAREDLPRSTRSLVNIGMMIAQNRTYELEMHIAIAFRNGCTKAEIREVLLQAAVYCGVPSGNQSFKIARKVFAEHPDAP